MQRIIYINKLGYPNDLTVKIVRKKSKSVVIHLPDDDVTKDREITRGAIDEIIDIQENGKDKITSIAELKRQGLLKKQG